MLETCTIDCPYCGEAIEILVDCSVAEQSYVEDCMVCCQPILLHVAVAPDGEPSVAAEPENG
ncbi:CPXCG motif-containing cysteine-rich protein [Thioalkalivibrio sp. XN279]|uniref:CPXCG motif-containing cysteine-rich protein n=1 Tax=Thioalkalivibrio sp. XN279 TaxID=2714953 RepID=UPI00140BDA4F|nr:CPXCG motif-containing cysteine-rich protein [Thioalkalivibrio sp. XN279]